VGIVSMIERVEQLGGRLDVTSSDHGTTGTTERVWLPLVKDAGWGSKGGHESTK